MDEDGKTNMEKSLEDIFNLEEALPIAHELKEKHDIDLVPEEKEEEPETIEYEDSVSEDMEYARENIRKMIDNSGEVINTLSYLARQSESPRAYEVLSNLISTLVSANKELIDIHKKGKQIKEGTSKRGNRKNNHDESSGGTTYNQTLYVGSTQELQKYLNDHKANT